MRSLLLIFRSANSTHHFVYTVFSVTLLNLLPRSGLKRHGIYSSTQALNKNAEDPGHHGAVYAQ